MQDAILCQAEMLQTHFQNQCFFVNFHNPVSYTIHGETLDQVNGCKIRGIRKSQSNSNAPYKESPNRWVKIEGSEYRVSNEEIKNWMNYLGNVISDIIGGPG